MTGNRPTIPELLVRGRGLPRSCQSMHENPRQEQGIMGRGSL